MNGTVAEVLKKNPNVQFIALSFKGNDLYYNGSPVGFFGFGTFSHDSVECLGAWALNLPSSKKPYPTGYIVERVEISALTALEKNCFNEDYKKGVVYRR